MPSPVFKLGAPITALLLLLAVSGAGAAETATAEVLATRQLLEDRDLSVGDTIWLSTDPNGSDPRPFRIAGSYEPIPDPFRLTAKRFELRMHLPDLLGMVADPSDPQDSESVDRINLTLADGRDGETLWTEIPGRVPGLHVFPATLPADRNVFVVLKRFHVAIAVVTVIGSTAFLLALMVMRADQRRETAGILRLIGFSRPRILQQVFLEAVLIAVVGAVFGVVMARVLQDAFNAFFQWYYDTALVFLHVTPSIAMQSVALAVPLGVVAGLLASWTLLRRGILTLIRR